MSKIFIFFPKSLFIRIKHINALEGSAITLVIKYATTPAIVFVIYGIQGNVKHEKQSTISPKSVYCSKLCCLFNLSCLCK